jgi:GrpB-like predicted nucleotidyltransferase (UPF0157 family)
LTHFPSSGYSRSRFFFSCGFWSFFWHPILDSDVATQIIVVGYDQSWPELFELCRRRLAGSVGNISAAIEPVGSTAVPGLAAKPIIDIDVLLAASELMPAAIERLAELGYRYQGNLGIAGREAFKASVTDLPHHLCVCPPGSREFQRHLAFRDYLRAHPVEAKAYGDLKMSLAEKFREDREAYVAGKTDFVTRITDLALAESSALTPFWGPLSI